MSEGTKEEKMYLEPELFEHLQETKAAKQKAAKA